METEARMLRADAGDGTVAEALEEGAGQALLVIHGGLGGPEAWKRVTDLLKDRYRTVRLHRRQYRLDLPRKVGMADELAHVTAIATELNKPIAPQPGRPAAPSPKELGEPREAGPARPGKPVIIGHSSGAVVALEALVARPELYSGAVLYEPPVVIGTPLGGEHGEIQRAARDAYDSGKPGKALTIFMRDIVKAPAFPAWLLGVLITHTRYQGRIVRQLDDNDAMDALGVRLGAYSAIKVPVLLLGGDKSPGHLSDRLDALEEALPQVTRVLLRGQGHGAETRAPQRVADAIARFHQETS
jgi:pimeloyl-ACP methyl ester carboxylesterase